MLQTAGAPNWGGVHDIVIDGLTIDGADLIGAGIFVTQGSHNITIQDCLIRNTGATGIALNATDYMTVDHNLIYHVGYNQGWSSGISLWYGGPDPTYGGPTAWYDRWPGFHNVIAYNVVSGTYDNSSHHTDGNGIIVDGSGSIPPALIAGNLIYENGGSGIEVSHNTGNIWVVNNTAYADALDRRILEGQAAEFLADLATNVHFVNNLAYGGENRTYKSALVYNNIASRITWAGNLGYRGSTHGVSASTTGDPRQYRYGNPSLASVPAIPSNRAPWATAAPPWSVGDAFAPRGSGPAPQRGVDPATVRGARAELARGLRRYATE